MSADRNRDSAEDLRLRTALFDRITGLPSVPVLFDELRALLDRRREIGLLHIGISNLSLAESVYGWQIFDRLLARLTAALVDMRGRELPEGTLFAQMSIHGSEVIAVIPDQPGGADVDASHLLDASARVEGRIREFLVSEEFASMVPRLEPRVGFALLSESPFYRFERSVYRAIEEARSRPQRREQLRRRSWGEEIQQVIRDEGISVHYQPVVELETLEILGYEALSRGPAGSGLESPAVMFEISREAGVSADLDRLCRRRALDSAHGIAPGRKIFMNTRLDNLADPDWGGRHIEQSLALLDLSPGDLVVEITQPSASTDEASVERWIKGLKKRGFCFAIDDIGTGYAGIQALERLGPDYLKIDISLVRRIDSNLIQQDLLGSLVKIGRRIGAAVIAEGIESHAEMDFLKSHGARYGQGFLFSAAVPSILPGPMTIGKEH